MRFWKKPKAPKALPGADSIATITPVTEPDPLTERVTARENQASLAARLAGVDTAHLTRAHTNPNLIEHADAERDTLHEQLITRERERAQLLADREHERLKREIDNEDRWARASAERENRAIDQGIDDATEARKDVAAVAEAQASTRPATAASTVARTQGRRTTMFLLFSGAASVVSAVGIGAALVASATATLTTAVVLAGLFETVLTVLVAVIIWTQAELRRHTQAWVREADGTSVRTDPAIATWANLIPWVTVAGLLSVSVAVNAWGATVQGTGLLGWMGMAGALIAAVTSFLGWGYSVQASAVIAANLASPSVAGDLAERRRVASGADIPDWGNPQRDTADKRPVDTAALARALMSKDRTAQEALFAAATHAFDEDGDGDGGIRPAGPAPDTTPSGGATVQGGTNTGTKGDTNADQHEDALSAPGGGTNGGTNTDQAKRADLLPHLRENAEQGDANRQRVLDQIRTHGPKLSNTAIGDALGLSRTAVRNHRKALAAQGHDVLVPKQNA